MRNYLSALICTGLLASAAYAGEVVERSYRVDLVLAADGTVQHAQAHESVPEAVADFLHERVSRWQFEPGTVNGEPAETETSMMIRLRATPDPEDPEQAQVDLVGVTIGAAKQSTVPPRYPRAAARANRQGMVVMEVEVDAEGSVLDARVLEDASRTAGPFRRAALDAVALWTFKPERVAGHGVPATVVVPICFTLHDPERLQDTSPMPRCEYSLDEVTNGATQAGELTLNPSATLLSDPTEVPTDN